MIMNLTSLRKAFLGTGENKEPKPVSIRDITVTILDEFISDYSDWYEARGLHLPEPFGADAAAYTEGLHKMKRAFNLLYDEMEETGELWDAKHKWEQFGEEDVQKIEELENEVKEGLALFGQALYYMTDPKKGTVKGQ